MLGFFCLSWFVLHLVDSQNITDRIINGDEVTPCDKYRFQAFVQGCGGSLITPSTVLTAGHCAFECVEWYENGECSKQEKIFDVTVHVGGFLSPGSPEKSTQQKGPLCKSHGIEIKGKFVHHPLYDPNPNSSHVVPDIALIHLDKKVKTKGRNGIVCLPQSNDNFANQTATVIGWGDIVQYNNGTDHFPENSPVLLETDIDVLEDDDERCDTDYPEDEICAFRNGTDSCQGDSGGPLFIAYAHAYIQIGIVANGLGCADTRGYPGYYTRVSNQLEWIRKNLKGKEPKYCF